MNELIEITGTITDVLPLQLDGKGFIVHDVILDNVTSIRNNTLIRSRVHLIARVLQTEGAIDFKVNNPITVRGVFLPGNQDTLDTIHMAHAPNGFIRYSGKIYR